MKGYRDKKATETKAAELERRGIRVDAGLVDPAEVHAKKPLAEHAEDFRRYSATKGNTQEYVGKMLFRLTAVLDRCRFTLIADKRCVHDALAGLSKLTSGDTDVRHARRDFVHEELSRLLDAARRSDKTIRCLPGVDRHFLYLTACATGFRVSELASMTPESSTSTAPHQLQQSKHRAQKTASWPCSRCLST